MTGFGRCSAPIVAPYSVSNLAPIALTDANRYDATDIIVLTTDDPETVRTWRRATRAALVVLTPPTAIATARQRATLLDAGADLCLTDPTSAELIAHLRALQRRFATPEDA